MIHFVALFCTLYCGDQKWILCSECDLTSAVLHVIWILDVSTWNIHKYLCDVNLDVELSSFFHHETCARPLTCLMINYYLWSSRKLSALLFKRNPSRKFTTHCRFLHSFKSVLHPSPAFLFLGKGLLCTGVTVKIPSDRDKIEQGKNNKLEEIMNLSHLSTYSFTSQCWNALFNCNQISVNGIPDRKRYLNLF